MPFSRSLLVPESLRGYRPRWLHADVLAGVSLAAVAIPEAMGYSSIAQVPLGAGLYSLIVPVLVFAVIGASRLMVVGADSATAALLASGIAGLGVAGLRPDSAQWLAWAGLIALVTGVMLLIAWVCRLGFLGDFLSTAVLTGFLAGIGLLVVTEQIPGILGLETDRGRHVVGKWIDILTGLGRISWPSVVFGVITVVAMFGVKKFRPQLPTPILAVVGGIAVVMIAHPESVKTIGHVDTGLPQVRFPAMSDVWSVAPQILTVSFGCVLVILAQSAATARSFAQSHGDHVDVNRDILGLAGSNVAAAFTGTFVVNSSPTKTAVLDQQKGRSQLANVTMAVTTLLVVAFATPLLEHLPEAVLAGIVFVVGVELVHARAFVSIWRIRPIECAVAVSTTLMVVFFGVLTGIVAAMVLSLLQMIHRQYRPKRFVIGLDDDGRRAYEKASPGRQTMPGLIVFRYDADLFYANVGRFADDVTALVKGARDPVKWLVLDVSATSDVDYSAARSMHSLIGFVHSIGAHFVLAGVTPELQKSLETAKIIADISPDSFYPGVGSAIKAFTKAHPAS